MSGGGGDSRVSIPTNVRKLINEIKKSLGFKHTDDFIYTTLIECHMDSNEAARRLKMIHDIREIAGKHSVEDVYVMLKECNMDPNEAAQRLLYIDTFHEVKKKHDRRKSISSDTSEEYKRTRGNQWQGAKGGRGTFHSSNIFDDVGGGRNLSSGKENGAANNPSRGSSGTMPAHSAKENNATPVANSASNANSTPAISNGSYSHKVAPKLSADVSSSTLDPVVAPTRHTCAVGTIKCEIIKRSGSSKSNAKLPAGNTPCDDHVVASIAKDQDSDDRSQSQPKSDVIEKNQMSDSLHPLSVLTNNDSHVVNLNQDNPASQLLNEPLKVTASEDLHGPTDNSNLVSGEESSELKQSSPKLDVMLGKLTLSSHQPVIFPNHFQVPENFKNQFTFGSLDATPDDCIHLTESTKQNGEVVPEPSLSKENVALISQEDEFQEHQEPHVSENTLPSKDNNDSSDTAIKHEQMKMEMIPPPMGGFQNQVLQTTRDYPYGFMPHLVGPHFVPLDVPEIQSGSSQVTSAVGPTSAAQSTTAGQSSIPLAPPMFPYYRQTYPNYIPYNPYYPHMYMPQNAHLLNHSIYPQPPPGATIYMQAGAAAGVKFTVPSQYKQGSNVGPHGVPSGYGYVTPGSFANEDDNKTKDNNDLHSAAQQGEDPQVWAREVPNLVPNYFYNFPHPHHMAFSPAIYHHSSPPMTAQPQAYQPQSQSLEPPPADSYQQPSVNWNATTTILNRETS